MHAMVVQHRKGGRLGQGQDAGCHLRLLRPLENAATDHRYCPPLNAADGSLIPRHCCNARGRFGRRRRHLRIIESLTWSQGDPTASDTVVKVSPSDSWLLRLAGAFAHLPMWIQRRERTPRGIMSTSGYVSHSKRTAQQGGPLSGSQPSLFGLGSPQRPPCTRHDGSPTASLSKVT